MTPKTFTLDKAFPLIARSISHRASDKYIASPEITQRLLKDSNARKLIVAARRKGHGKDTLEHIASNMVGFFGKQRTMQDDKWMPLFDLFDRVKDGPRWAYRLKNEVTDADVIFEGAIIQRSVNIYERSSLARLKCIDEYGAKCSLCCFSFGAAYGKKFNKCILVHHLRPLSEIRRKHAVDPIADLRPVCANCHIVLHAHTPAYSIQELRSFLRRNRIQK